MTPWIHFQRRRHDDTVNFNLNSQKYDMAAAGLNSEHGYANVNNRNIRGASSKHTTRKAENIDMFLRLNST